MLSFVEALAEDTHPAVCADAEDDFDPLNGWDLDLFPEVELRPELRLFAGTPPDVLLRCRGGRVLSAHRAVLTEASYFESLFDGGFAEHAADGLDVDEDPQVLFEVLRWIYCQDAAVDKDIVLEVFRLAEFYGIEGLIDHCARVFAAQDAIVAGKASSQEADRRDASSSSVLSASVGRSREIVGMGSSCLEVGGYPSGGSTFATEAQREGPRGDGEPHGAVAVSAAESVASGAAASSSGAGAEEGPEAEADEPSKQKDL